MRSCYILSRSKCHHKLQCQIQLTQITSSYLHRIFFWRRKQVENCLDHLTIKMPSKRKRVQVLADVFWKQWRENSYSFSIVDKNELKSRKKPHIHWRCCIIIEGQFIPSLWLEMAVLEHVFPSVSDQKVYKAQLRVDKDNVNTLDPCLVTEILLLMAVYLHVYIQCCYR